MCTSSIPTLFISMMPRRVDIPPMETALREVSMLKYVRLRDQLDGGRATQVYNHLPRLVAPVSSTKTLIYSMTTNTIQVRARWLKMELIISATIHIVVLKCVETVITKEQHGEVYSSTVFLSSSGMEVQNAFDGDTLFEPFVPIRRLQVVLTFYFTFDSFRMCTSSIPALFISMMARRV